jgi:hypothetical protein
MAASTDAFTKEAAVANSKFKTSKDVRVFLCRPACCVTGVTDIGEWRTTVRFQDDKEEELAMTSFPITRNATRSVYSGLRTRDGLAGGWLHAFISDRNLMILAALCLIGLLVTLNLIFRFPVFQPSSDEISQILG